MDTAGSHFTDNRNIELRNINTPNIDHFPEQKQENFMNRRTLSSRKDKRTVIKNLTSNPSARTLHGARSIHLKPDLVMNKNQFNSKLVPSYEAGRGHSVQLKKAVSERKMPTLSSKQSVQQTLGTVLPPMKRSLTRRTLAGSSLNRMYSNPQFTKLNQAPYFRPKTSAFGYLNGDNPRKDPSKKAPWTSEEVGSITGIKTMTSLAPANAKLKKDKTESSPTKRALSRKERRKNTSQNTHRLTFQGGFVPDKRPNTSYLLQAAANRMPWPKKPEGRAKINPLTPVKAFTFKGDKESQFLHSEKDFKMTIENFPEEAEYYLGSQHSRIDEEDELDREELEANSDLISLHSGVTKAVTRRKQSPSRAKNPTISDVIKLLKNEPKETGQYFYLTQPEESGPYDLQPLLELEDHNKLQNYRKFYTLSNKGITTYLNDEPVEFITLNDWLADKENYNKIRKKTFFQKFDRWKILRLWRRKICVKKRETVSEILQDKLFILHKHFSKVILELKSSCNEMEKLNFIELTETHEAISREEFSNKQDKRRNLVEDKIQSHSRKCREDFREGIKNILTDLKQKITQGNENDDATKIKDEGEQK